MVSQMVCGGNVRGRRAKTGGAPRKVVTTRANQDDNPKRKTAPLKSKGTAPNGKENPRTGLKVGNDKVGETAKMAT